MKMSHVAAIAAVVLLAAILAGRGTSTRSPQDCVQRYAGSLAFVPPSRATYASVLREEETQLKFINCASR
jgi:hypothetical protein